MDRIPGAPLIDLQFMGLRVDGPPPRAWHELLLRIVADFAIVYDQREIYHEQEFCVVELAYQLRRWLAKEGLFASPFQYESMEAEETPLLWFRLGAHGWVLGTLHRTLVDHLQLEDLKQASESFVAELLAEVPRQLGLDVTDVIDSRP